MIFVKVHAVFLVVVLQFLGCKFEGDSAQSPTLPSENYNVERQINFNKSSLRNEGPTDFEHENLRRNVIRDKVNAKAHDTTSTNVNETLLGNSTNKIGVNDEKLHDKETNNENETKTMKVNNTNEDTGKPDTKKANIEIVGSTRQANISRVAGKIAIIDENETVSENVRRIVGGKGVDISAYPYHAAYGVNCAGSIIDKKWIITVAHCGEKPYIRTGSSELSKGKQSRVKSFFPHPGWSEKNKEHAFDFDFQLLELAEELTFDDNTKPIEIASDEDMKEGKMITVTGWGNMEEDGAYSNILRAVSVPVISKEVCQRVPFPYFRGQLTPRMFCAGYVDDKKDACQGDSGGPAAFENVLLGMVSFGYGCATPGSYGVYSQLSIVRSWIESTIGFKLRNSKTKKKD